MDKAMIIVRKWIGVFLSLWLFAILLVAQAESQAGQSDAVLPSVKTSVDVGKKIYDEYCSACHAAGKLGAFKTADTAHWQGLIDQGIETLMFNTLNGYQNMPKKGGCMACSNKEVIAAVIYMLQQSNAEGDYSLWLRP